MVVRCSNEAPFVVLEAAAAVRTGIRIEVAHGDDPATVIDVLPDTWGRQWRDPLKGPGTGSFSIHAQNPHLTANPGILDYGNIVRCYLDEVLRFAFLIEKKTVTVAGEGDDAARVVNVSGRGVLAKLEESVVYLSEGLSGDVERTSEGFLNAGWWMEELLIESLLRGELTAVTRAFTFERDSNGALWEVPLLINERAGTDLLRVAERHAEVAVDAWMSPTLALHYYNERGVDRTIQTDFVAPVILRPGHNIVELSADEDGVIRNVLLIETPAGWLERSDPASVGAYGRRVSFLSLGNVTDGGQVDRVADAIFARNAQPAPDLTLEVADVDDHRPYLNFGVGDWVLAPNLDGNLVKHRVRAINVTEDDEGRPRFPIELATVGDELETRMARWLEAMSRGTMGGVAGEVAEPTKAPSEVQAAAITIVETGVDEHVANDPHPSTLSDLTDVDTATDPPADNEVLTYRTALGLWVPRPGGGGGGGGIEPVAPSEIASLAAHYDAQSITGLANNDPVSQWDDLSGAGRHLTSSGSKRPLHAVSSIGGHPAVVFDGSDDGMDAPWSGASGTDMPWSALVVCRPGTGIGSDATPVALFRTTSTTPFHAVGRVSGRYRAFRRHDAGGGGTPLFGGVWPLEVDTIVVFMFDGIRMRIWANGILETIGDEDQNVLTLDRISVGANFGTTVSGSGQWLGPIGEVAVFGGTFTGNERRGLEQYASARWGIPV